MKRKILVMFVVCLGLMALIPNVNSTSKIELQLNDDVWYDTQLYAQEGGGTNDTNYGSGDGFTVSNTINAQEVWTTVFWFKDNYVSNGSTIYDVTLDIACYSGTIAGVWDMNISVFPLYSGFNESQATWNNRSDGQLWKTEGGHYNSSYLIDKITILDGSFLDTHTYNLTTIYKDWVHNATPNYGIILVCMDGFGATRGVNYRSSEYSIPFLRPILNITYSGGATGGQSTNILKDVWNLKGYAGGSPKLASVIYSEISDCLALSWKNATTGYWYTYYPSLGLTEDTNLNFGDGLFILTDQNSTWDHT